MNSSDFLCIFTPRNYIDFCAISITWRQKDFLLYFVLKSKLDKFT